MKPTGCEQENALIRAIHSDQWTYELRSHLSACADCSQALRVAEALQAEARRAQARFNPPDAHWILQRSRRMAREIAVRRVGRLLAIMRVLAACYVIVAAAWFLRGYAALQYREVASELHGASGNFALLAAAAAFVCVAVGLWPILLERVQRRSSH